MGEPMTDDDRGREALAKLLPEADLAWIAHRDASSLPPTRSVYEHAAEFILGDRAVFLPEGLPPQGLGPYYRKQIAVAEAEIARLRVALDGLRTDNRDEPCWCPSGSPFIRTLDSPEHSTVCTEARAALRPEPARRSCDPREHGGKHAPWCAAVVDELSG